MLRIDLASRVPVYEQIANGLRAELVSGEFNPGEKLPTVRTLAIDLGVHHNTVAEAYRQLLAPEPVQPWGMRWVRRGALGLVAVSVGRWMWRRRAGEVASRAEPLPRGPAAKAATQRTDRR